MSAVVLGHPRFRFVFLKSLVAENFHSKRKSLGTFVAFQSITLDVTLLYMPGMLEPTFNPPPFV
jgi:hypothetical protein